MIATRIKTALKGINNAYDDTLTPARRATESHALTPATNPPLPIPADILDKRATAHETLAYWSRIVINTKKLHLLPSADVHDLCAFLTIHANTLVPWPKALTELETSAEALGVIAADNAPHRFAVGPCPGNNCTGIVKATVRADDDLLPSTLRCTGTPTHEWPAGEWRILERRLRLNTAATRRDAVHRLVVAICLQNSPDLQ